MEITQLRYFQKLATLEHLTRAADELYISQSTLSTSISRLESELGVSLFDRKGRGIRLNTYGEAFLLEVNRALAHIDLGVSNVKSIQRREQNHIQIITPTIMGFPGLMQEIEQAYKDIHITSMQCSLSGIVPRLITGEVDFCIIALELKDPVLEGCTLRQQEMGCVLPASNPLAGRESVTVQELADLEFVAYPPGSTQRTLFAELFAAQGVTPTVIYESDNYYELLRAVSMNGCAATVVRDMYRNYHTEDTVFIPISDAKVDASLRLYWLKRSRGEERPVIGAVREVIKNHFNTGGDF